MPAGRPSDYTTDVAALICARMAEGESLRSVCRDDAMPSLATVFRWLGVHEEFQEQYARAIEARATVLEGEIIEIADDDSGDVIADPESGNAKVNAEFVARSRLRVDTRKWIMARMAPKKYGDRVEQVQTGDPEKPVHSVTRIERVIVRSDKQDASDALAEG